jgi:TPR repeat protein
VYLDVGTVESNPGPRIAHLKSLADAEQLESAAAAFYYGLVLLGELQLMVPGQLTRPVRWTKFIEYFATIGLENVEQEARSYIEKAAYLDFAPAQVRIGKAYEFSEMGLEQDKLSVQYYGLASAQGDPHADMALSRWFVRGIDGLFEPDAYMVYAFAAKAAHDGESAARRLVGLCRDLQITSREDQYLGAPWYGEVSFLCNQY